MELTPEDIAWNKIFDQYDILSHNFEDSPFVLSAEQIKKLVKHLIRLRKRSHVFFANKIQGKIDPIYLWKMVCSYCLKRINFIIY